MSTKEWRIAPLAELPESGALEFHTGKGEWPFRGFLVRWAGQVFAYANRCAHLGHPLNMAPDRFFTPDKSLLVCASHGALFKPDTGLCVNGPCAGAQLRSLPCRVEGGYIYVTAPDTMLEK